MTRHALAWLIRLITGVRRSREQENSGHAKIYFANHSSHLDFVVIWAALPAVSRERARPVAAADYWGRGPFRRWLVTTVFKAVLVPRGKLTRDDDPIGMMGAVLEEGNDLIIFPEGTRSLDGRVAEFRHGLFALARRYPQAELVPVYLENLNRILPKGEFFLLPLMGNAIFGHPCAGPRETETRHDFLVRARESLLELAGNALESTPLSPSDEH